MSPSLAERTEKAGYAASACSFDATRFPRQRVNTRGHELSASKQGGQRLVHAVAARGNSRRNIKCQSLKASSHMLLAPSSSMASFISIVSFMEPQQLDPISQTAYTPWVLQNEEV